MAKLTEYRTWVLRHWERGGWSAAVRHELLCKKGQHEIKMLVKHNLLERDDLDGFTLRITDAGRAALEAHDDGK